MKAKELVIVQYNIKIKANDGEFSLNSQDKDIIAREMDLYFSYFFHII